LRLDRLVVLCRQRLIGSLDWDDLACLLLQSRACQEEELYQAVLSHIARSPIDLTDNESYMQLAQKHPAIVADIFRHLCKQKLRKTV
ncbi:hypothetical protein Ciccas_014503, partial [Cichlidogyrus casuarinus]